MYDEFILYFIKTTLPIKYYYKVKFTHVQVPHNSSFGQMDVTISNAFEAPYFILGKCLHYGFCPFF
jgi:hypothetical protein